jgi:segregation and condensation protein B
MSLKGKIESVLYTTDKPMKAQVIAQIINEDVQVVRQTLLELIREYEERDGGLEISDDNGYSFQVKEPYSSIMNDFLPIEMSAALIRTLSAIAIKQPIAQSEIIRVRGAGAYEHIRELVERDLVAKKDDGRSPELSTTKKFQDYFRLSKDGKSLREILKKEAKKAGIVPGEEGEGLSEGDKPEDVQLTIDAIQQQESVADSSDEAATAANTVDSELIAQAEKSMPENESSSDAVTRAASDEESDEDLDENDDDSEDDEVNEESKDNENVTSFAPPAHNVAVQDF